MSYCGMQAYRPKYVQDASVRTMMDTAESRRSMVHSAAIKAGVLCILGVLTVSCLATGRHPEHNAEATITHTTTSARVSMLRRGRQEASASSSPLQQAGPFQETSQPTKFVLCPTTVEGLFFCNTLLN